VPVVSSWFNFWQPFTKKEKAADRGRPAQMLNLSSKICVYLRPSAAFFREVLPRI